MHCQHLGLVKATSSHPSKNPNIALHGKVKFLQCLGKNLILHCNFI